MFNNKVILISGGTGSFGQALCREILSRYKPKKIIIFSRDELKQYNMANDNFFKKHMSKLRFFIGDVRDLDRLKFATTDVNFVVHAAALKQVVASEYNPFETVKTNIIGAQNIIEASFYNKVEKIIALSTDKACRPVNLYGATKLASDKLFIAANNLAGKSDTSFSVVRYGNVMGSRGSVIPFFLANKSKVYNVTDSNMTRFNITLDQCTNFVINCFKLMKGAEIFVPKMPSYKILDLVKSINNQAEVKIIGIRPGEKIHESLIDESDYNVYEHKKHYVIYPNLENFLSNRFKKITGKKIKNFSYTSGSNKNFLQITELKKLINENVLKLKK